MDFAHAYNISESNLHNWLKREAPPLQKHWQPLADFFGCSVEYIAYGDGDENIGGAASVHEGITLPGSSHSSDGAAELRLEIHERINHLIEAANGDVGKLGWVREQLALHLRRPDHWATSDSRDR